MEVNLSAEVIVEDVHGLVEEQRCTPMGTNRIEEEESSDADSTVSICIESCCGVVSKWSNQSDGIPKGWHDRDSPSDGSSIDSVLRVSESSLSVGTGGYLHGLDDLLASGTTGSKHIGYLKELVRIHGAMVPTGSLSRSSRSVTLAYLSKGVPESLIHIGILEGNLGEVFEHEALVFLHELSAHEHGGSGNAVGEDLAASSIDLGVL